MTLFGAECLDRAHHELRHLREILKPSRIAYLDANINFAAMDFSLREKLDGYVTLQHSFDQVRDMIHACLRGGEMIFCDAISGRTRSEAMEFLKRAPEPNYYRLSRREKMLLQLMVKGLDMPKCSAEMGITVKSVDNIKTRLMKKLNVHTALQLVVRGRKFGL